MIDNTQRTLGSHDARITNIENTVKNISEKVDKVLENQAQQRGAWKAATTAGSFLGALAGFFGSKLMSGGH